jgi:two-component system cell cycle response regulator
MKVNEKPVRVLLVEGNPQDAQALKETFCGEEGAACEITIVTRLCDALDRLLQSPPDAVILDLFLADSSGLETLRQLHLAVPNIPVVVLADSRDEGLALRAIQEGAQDYLVKGEFTARDLSRSLRYALERHRLLLAVESLTVTDELTGLHNRRGFLSIARHQLELVRRNKGTAALVYADLDGLKEINDHLGHDEGDRALVEVADILRASFRQSDVLGRLGGDEFTVLALDPGLPGSPMVVRRLRRALQRHNNQSSRRYLLSLSIGLEWSTGGGAISLEEFLRRADAEMYKQKRERRIAAGDIALARTAELKRSVTV